MNETGEIKTINLPAIQPDELAKVNPELYAERKNELIALVNQGFQVRIEVQYSGRLSQIYQYIPPEKGEVTWDPCRFKDITPPYGER
jgi:hypothetical protein